MSDADFETAKEWVAANVKSLTDDQQLQFYGLFKQATVGDVNTGRPGIFDQKGRYKWDAWNTRKGMSQEDAKKAYIDLVEEFKAKLAAA